MTTPPRVALVTGSGKKRVGRTVARMLAQEGFAIAVHYRGSQADAQDAVRDFAALGVPARAYQADLADELSVRQMVANTLTDFHQIDVLVNCAAIWKRKQLEEVTAQDVRDHFEINTLGTFITCQQVGLAMVNQPQGGVIINFGDWAEVRPYLDYAAYFPSKGAVTALTKCMAVELGTRNPKVRVNAIMPGPVMLPDDMPQSEKDHVINSTLVKREGTPDNVAQAVKMLVFNDFLTGVCLPVDGGRTVFAPG
jgi:pteridine reductase